MSSVNWQVLADYCVRFTAGHMKEVMSFKGFNGMKSDVAHKFMCSLTQYDVFKT